MKDGFSKANDPRRHHFVPQMLQKRFVDGDEKIHVFDKRKKKYWRTTIKDVFVKRDLYSTKDQDGKRDHSIETDFFNPIETAADQVIGKVVNSVRSNQVPALSEEEKTAINEFMDAQWRRTPDMKDHVGIDTVFKHVVDQAIEEILERRPLTNSENDLLSNLKELERMSENGWVSSMDQPMGEPLQVFGEMGLCFAKASNIKSTFVIGSFPVVKITTSNHTHIADPKVEVWLPISHDIAVLPRYKKGTIEVLQINSQGVRYINECMFKQSTTIAGPSLAQVRSLSKNWLKAQKSK